RARTSATAASPTWPAIRFPAAASSFPARLASARPARRGRGLVDEPSLAAPRLPAPVRFSYTPWPRGPVRRGSSPHRSRRYSMSTRLLTIVSLSLALVPAVSGAAETKGFVLTTDFSTGELSVVDLSTREVRVDVAQPPVPSSDARIRWHGGLIYLVNRTGSQSANNIQVIDPTQGYRTVRQFSTGSGSNPSDIAFASPGKAYVSLFGSPNLLVVNPMTGGTIKTISLSAFADADGNPEADRMVRIGRWLYVSLERLVNFAPTETSLVAVIDTQADTVLDVDPSRPGKQAIVLTGGNPVTSFEFDRRTSRLLIGCAGQYGALD